MIQSGFKLIKGGFFDAEAVLDDSRRFEAQAQSRFGAFTRRTMKNSIKYADGISAPGRPPHAHRSKGFTKANKKTGAKQSQSPLRELIYFARDPATGSVVIGPVPFGRDVAGVVEGGGTTTATDPLTGKTVTQRHHPHPFADPAGRAEARKFPELLRGMVK